MTAKDKALELYSIFYERYPDCMSNEYASAEAKFCTSVVIAAAHREANDKAYWEAVKRELDIL